MDSHCQSVFGGLGKKNKKKKKHKKGRPFHPQRLESGQNLAKDEDQTSKVDQNVNDTDDNHGEIRFVLPRSSCKDPSDQLIPFYLPGQLKKFSLPNPHYDDSLRPENDNVKIKDSPHIEESIDDILFPGKKRKEKEPKSSNQKNVTQKSQVSNQNDHEKSMVDEVPLIDTANSSRSNHNSEKDGATNSTTKAKGDRGEDNSKELQKQDEQSAKLDRNCANVSGRSVEDAVRDKVGRRPRANSTDGELNLPQRGLCDEHIVLQSHVWNMRRQDNPRGFVNLGNTCFLNATLQCLIYMPSFCQSITALPPSCYETNGDKKKQHGQHITMKLRALLRGAHGVTALEKNESPNPKPIAPKAIFKAITSCKTQGHRFRAGRQEDAHELLVHLLDAMHEGELFAAGINPHASGWRDRLPIPRLDETTFVHRIFGGYFRSQLRCNKCGYKSNTYDPFLDLALEVSKKHLDSLSAAFKEFTRKETLDSDNRWKCSGCKRLVCPTKHLSVFRPPLSLCIQLKRFAFEGSGFMKGGWGYGHRHGKGLGMFGNGGSKIIKKIDFPARLSLPLSDGRTCDYLLTGIIVHVGHSATTGHYTAFVKKPGDSSCWYHMDDSFVETVSEKTVLKQRDAYVLFYSRKEVKLEFPQPPPREMVQKNGIKAKLSPSSNGDNAAACASGTDFSKSKKSDAVKNSLPMEQKVASSKKSHSLNKPTNGSVSSSSLRKMMPTLSEPSSGTKQTATFTPIDSSSVMKHLNEANSNSESESSSSDSQSSINVSTKNKTHEESNRNRLGEVRRSLNYNQSKLSGPDIPAVALHSHSTLDAGALSPKTDSVQLQQPKSKAEKWRTGKDGHDEEVRGIKSIKGSKEKMMQGNNVEVVLSRRKKKAWNPSKAAHLNSGNELLGNISVQNWNDFDEKIAIDDSCIDMHFSSKRSSLRNEASKTMESRDKSRKRKMYLDSWDAMIDEGRKKKVKTKDPGVGNDMRNTSDSFHRIQRDRQRTSKGRKGHITSTGSGGRISSFKTKKQRALQRTSR